MPSHHEDIFFLFDRPAESGKRESDGRRDVLEMRDVRNQREGLHERDGHRRYHL